MPVSSIHDAGRRQDHATLGMKIRDHKFVALAGLRLLPCFLRPYHLPNERQKNQLLHVPLRSLIPVQIEVRNKSDAATIKYRQFVKGTAWRATAVEGRN